MDVSVVASVAKLLGTKDRILATAGKALWPLVLLPSCLLVVFAIIDPSRLRPVSVIDGTVRWLSRMIGVHLDATRSFDIPVVWLAHRPQLGWWLVVVAVILWLSYRSWDYSPGAATFGPWLVTGGWVAAAAAAACGYARSMLWVVGLLIMACFFAQLLPEPIGEIAGYVGGTLATALAHPLVVVVPILTLIRRIAGVPSSAVAKRRSEPPRVL